MTEPNLRLQLDRIARTYRRFQLWRGLAVTWGTAALLASILLLVYSITGWWRPEALYFLFVAAGLGAIVAWRRSRRIAQSYRWIAQQIEFENPKLRSALLAAVEQEPLQPDGTFSYLQERVIIEALSQNKRQPWIQRYVERLFFAQCTQWALLAVFAGVVLGLTAMTPRQRVTLAEALSGVEISPGDANVERGNSLVVLARFGRRLPTDAVLVVHPAAGPSRRIPLAKNLNDPVFGGTIPEVASDLLYHVEYAGQRTRSFKVQVFDYPALQQADAHLKFPEYTKQPEKTIEDTRRVSAVEGSTLDYVFRLNKPVATARLVGRDDSTIPLAQDKSRANVYAVQMNLTPEQGRIYELQLVDHDGRTNKLRTDIVIDVLTNRLPELKLAFPRQDLRVSPLEEVHFQAHASDDFGLQAYGLAYTLAGQETKFIELGQETAAHEKREFAHVLSLESLSAKPDDLVTYFLWADDYGPDGAIRRSSGDMYFAEVRHFEEIFREGQQQPQSESMSMSQGQQSQSERLAELQKEIINATWKLQRRETGAKPSKQYKEDVTVVKESQEKALEQAEEMQSRVENPTMKPLIDKVVDEMKRARDRLADASRDNSAKALPEALAAEQAAYQALLKLQAREYEVTRGNRQRGGGGGGQRAQRQLDQLELRQSENRYETQRQALSQQQSPEQREELQVLNRLKELARRQQDLNERLKELQTALQEARTEEEREEVRKRLKRLREEQQQMLADVDELRQRMSRPENQSQMSEARKQLDETRSEVRQAAEELENGAVSQALASGARAQRDLQQLRDDFRKRTSNQFSEEMRQMRNEARELAQREEEIARQLEAMAESQRKTLSDSAQRNELAEQLARQKSYMTNLLDHMRRVTEQSEAAEPLLSKQLYDTIRRTNQSKVESALDSSAELLRRGFVPQAAQAEQQARTSIEDLKQSVERAAESVLGDETEAIRRARNEVEDLARQLENEMARAQPQQQNGDPSSDAQRGSGPRDATGQPRQSQSGQREGEPNRDGQGREVADARSPEQGRGERAEGQENQGERAGRRQEQGQREGQGERQRQEQASANNEGQGRGENQQGQRSGSPQPGQRGQQGQQGSASDGVAQNEVQQNQDGQGNRGGNTQRENGNRNSSQRRGLASNDAQNRGGGNTRENSGGRRGFFDDATERTGGGPTGPGGPLTGNEFTNWSDRLRDVEETLDFPDLRNRVAEIRERAREVRIEFKRHSLPPQWDLVKATILAPLVEVRQRLTEELAQRESKDALVPIDRDPVPGKYSELVRRYYETLGKND